MSPDAAAIYEILRSAYYCRHSVADEVAASVRGATEAYTLAVSKPARTEAQHRMLKSVADRNSARLKQLAELTAAYTSFRGELGSLPVFRDREAKCEAEIAAWAARLAGVVEQRAWDSLRTSAHQSSSSPCNQSGDSAQ
jgi:hypothetical protein